MNFCALKGLFWELKDSIYRLFLVCFCGYFWVDLRWYRGDIEVCGWLDEADLKAVLRRSYKGENGCLRDAELVWRLIFLLFTLPTFVIFVATFFVFLPTFWPLLNFSAHFCCVCGHFCWKKFVIFLKKVGKKWAIGQKKWACGQFFLKSGQASNPHG